MNVKKMLVILVAAALALISSAKPSATVEVVGANKYLTFGSGSVLSEHSAIQTDVNVSWDNGFFLNLWLSRPMRSGVSKLDLVNENDYGLGWNGKVGYWSVGASLTYFDSPRLGRFGAGDIWYTSLKASHGCGPIDIDLCYDAYTPLHGSDFEGQHLPSLGVSKKFDFSEWLSVSCFVKIAYDDGGFGYGKGFLARYGGELTWKVSKKISLVLPRVEAYSPFGIRDERKTDAMFFGGVSVDL